MSEDTKPIKEESAPDDEDETEGHSLATYEYGRLVSRERSQDAERHARESRMREKDRKGR